MVLALEATYRGVLDMQVIAERPLTRYRLQQIINTREQDLLEPSQPQATAELEAYAEGTATQLLFLQVPSASCAPVSVDDLKSTPII